MRGFCGWRAVGAAAVIGWGLIAVGLGSAAAQEQPKEPKSSEEALVIYTDAANFQNNGAFDLAADEWEKFLKKFPKDPLVAKAQHYLGVCNLQLKKFDKAAAAFQEVVTNHPKFDNLQEAYLNLGWCQFSLAGQNKDEKLYAAAAKTFAEQVEKFPGEKGKFTDQALYFWGESEYAQGKKKEAVAAYDRLVKEYPKSSLRRDAMYALGVTQEELSQFAEAGKIYDLFLKEFAESEQVTEVKMRKAETVLQAGDFAAADTQFGEVAAVKDFKSADHAIYRQAFCRTKQDKYAEAATLYAKIPVDFKESTYLHDATIAAARCFYRANDDKNAAEWLTKVIDAGKGDVPEAAHWLSRIHLKSGKPAEVVALVDKVLPNAGEDQYVVNLKMDKADALFESADTRAAALDAFVAIATDHPKHELAPQALYNAAFAALDLKKYDDGIKLAADFVKQFPQDKLLPDVKYITAECNLQLKNYDAAEAAYRELVANPGEHPEAEQWQVRLGLALFLQKKYADAVAALEPAIAKLKKPEYIAEANYLIGASQFSLEKADAAIGPLEASLKAAPKWRQADETLLFLARAYRKQDKLDEAIKTVSQLIAEFPESKNLVQAHYRLGEFQYAKDDFAGAMKEYEAVIAADANSPFAPYAVYGKGWCQMKAKAYKEAVASFADLIGKQPQHPLVAEAKFARALCLRQDGQFAEAIADFNAFLETKPDKANQSDALYERGLAEVALKKYPDAVASFTTLLKDDEKYAGADKVLYEWAWALKSQEDAAAQKDAIGVFARLAKEHPQSSLAAEAHFHVGESLYDAKEYDAASKEYTAAKDAGAKGDLGEKTVYKLGWSRFQLKDYETALAQFNSQIADYANGALLPDGTFMKGECLFRLEKYDEALPVFTAAKKTKASSPVIEVLTQLHGGQCASQLKKWDEAIAWLSPIAAAHPETPYLAEVAYELGWAKQNAGQEKEAEADYETAATKSRGEVGARARFMIGELYFNRKDYENAVKQFQRVMFGYGGDTAPAEIKKWQAKAGYEAGRCAEVRIKDAKPAEKAKLIADAKTAYSYVIEKHAMDDLAAEAKKRVDALASL